MPAIFLAHGSPLLLDDAVWMEELAAWARNLPRPKAVLMISISSLEPAPLLALGRALAPLRDEGVLIVGSGFLTHNLQSMRFDGGPPPSWATELDAWAADVLARRDVDALLNYRERAPGVRQALPTHEHFVPVIAALGASVDAPDAVRFPVAGFTYGSATKRSVQFG
jgi:4,5-DOPA dioxygenase extradiol